MQALRALHHTLKGRYRYIRSGVDPEQLYDLREDPLELDNIADKAMHESDLGELRTLASRKWYIEELSERVRLSQRRRLFLAGLTRPTDNWDFNADDQASEQCLRADRSYNDWAYDDVIEVSQ